MTLPDDGSYETVGGFIMADLGRVPDVGDRVDVDGATLEVLAMDGHRIDRVRVARGASAAADLGGRESDGEHSTGGERSAGVEHSAGDGAGGNDPGRAGGGVGANDG